MTGEADTMQEKVFVDPHHSSQMLVKMADLWKQSKYCDAFLSVGNMTFQMHKLILLAASSRVQSLPCSVTVKSKMEVFLPADISKDGVIAFLSYLYEGALALTVDNLPSVEKLGKFFETPRVLDYCEAFRELQSVTSAEKIENVEQFRTGGNTSGNKDLLAEKSCLGNENIIIQVNEWADDSEVKNTVTANPQTKDAVKPTAVFSHIHHTSAGAPENNSGESTGENIAMDRHSILIPILDEQIHNVTGRMELDRTLSVPSAMSASDNNVTVVNKQPKYNLRPLQHLQKETQRNTGDFTSLPETKTQNDKEAFQCKDLNVKVGFPTEVKIEFFPDSDCFQLGQNSGPIPLDSDINLSCSDIFSSVSHSLSGTTSSVTGKTASTTGPHSGSMTVSKSLQSTSTCIGQMPVHSEISSASTISTTISIESEDKFHCNKCGKGFITRNLLQMHWIKEHSDSQPFIIRCCHKVFLERSEYDAHRQSCHAVETLECDTTTLKEEPSDDYWGKQLDSDRREVVTLGGSQHEANQDQRAPAMLSYLCDDCGKSFISRSGLYRHRRNKHLSQPRYICSICNQTFMEKDPYEAHINTHRQCKPHRCSKCEKVFGSRMCKNRHEKSCSRHVRPTFICDHCQHKFSRRDILDNHIEGKHRAVFKYHCNVHGCDSNFKWRSSLSKHKIAHKRAQHHK